MSMYSTVEGTSSLPEMNGLPNVSQYGWTAYEIDNYTQLGDYVDQCKKYFDGITANVDYIKTMYEAIFAIKTQVDIIQANINTQASAIKEHYDIIEGWYAQIALWEQELKDIQSDVNVKHDEVVALADKVSTTAADIQIMHDAIKISEANAKDSETNSAIWFQRCYDLYLDLQKGQVYRGTWNPNSGAYPAHAGTNSAWDVILNEGQEEVMFDGKRWWFGDRLVYALVDNTYYQIESGTATGVKSVNGKNGAVVLTAHDVDAYTQTETDAKLDLKANKRYVDDELEFKVDKITAVNGHELKGNITLTSADIGSLAISKNLSDVGDVETAKQNIGVDRVVQAGTNTSLGKSGSYRLAVNDSGEWGALDPSNNWKALDINKGGTGAITAANARMNLAVDKLNQLSASTNLNYPSKNAAFVLRDSDLVWGVFSNEEPARWVALGVAQGGTGASNPADARTSLGLGTAAVRNIGTSGGNVPLLNGTNSWDGVNDFNASLTRFANTSASSGNGIEVGSTTTVSTSYIDFHSSGTTADYDTRISTTGGSSTYGQGKMTVHASALSTANLELGNALPINYGGTGSTTYTDALRRLNAMQYQRTSLSVNDNLNNIDGGYAGFFLCSSNAVATSANNYPVNQAGSLLVMTNAANNGGGCTQFYYPYNSNDIYTRTKLYSSGSAFTWTGWNILLQQGSFGLGSIEQNRPGNQNNQFISDSDGATLWAPANGVGVQVSYANQRCGQIWMSTSGKMFSRFNLISANAQEPRANLSWFEVAYKNDANTWTQSNTFTGATLFRGSLTNDASTPLEIRSNNPTIRFAESDAGGSAYLFVGDGGDFRMNLDSTGGLNIFKYTRTSNTLAFGAATNAFTNNVTVGGNIYSSRQLQVASNGETIRMIAPTGQACYLMGMTENVTDSTKRRWYVGNGGSNNDTVLVNSKTNGSLNVAATGAVIIAAKSTGTGTGNTLTTNFNTDGNIIGPKGTVTQTASDVLLKSDIVEAKGGALGRINAIGCVEFTWDGEGRRDRGFIAQQLSDIDDLYTFRPDEDSYLNYSITALMSDTFGAIQELSDTVDKQQKQIDELKKLVETLVSK